MSEMEVTEGQLLSQDFGVGGPPAAVEVAPPPRTVETVTLEIRTLQRQAQQIMLGYAVEIGRRLEEVKAILPHGQWGDYLKNEVDYSQSTANNFMRIYREYGAAQQSLFGGEAKSQAFANLTYTKALRLLAIPNEEEREQFMAEHDVEGMSNRELDKALKEREEALEAAAAAQDEARRLRQETERLQEQLTGQAQVYEAKLASASIESQQARKAQEKAAARAQRLQDALSEANAATQAAENEHTRLVRELEELKNRPVDVAVEVDQTAVDKLTEQINKARAKATQAEEKRKAAEESLEAAQKELADLKAKGPEVRELTQEEKDALTADAVEKARAEGADQIRCLEKKLAAANPNIAEFKVRYAAWQEEHRKMMEVLGHIAQASEEQAAKLRQAVKAALEQMAKS